MASKEENIKRFQEIANRGIQDKLPADKRAIFDEALRRGLITMPSAVVEPEPIVEQPQVVDQPAQQPQPEPRGFWDKVGDVSSNISSQINRTALGMGETALNVGSAMIAEPVAGWAGIGAMVPGGRTPAEAVAATREAMTYQPRTEAGIQAQEELGTAMAPVGRVIEAVESGAGEAGYQGAGLIPGVSPEAQAATGAVFSAIPAAIAEILGFKGTRAAKVAALKDKVAQSSVTDVMTPEVVSALRVQGFTDADIAKIISGDPKQLERLQRFREQNIQPTRGDITQDPNQRKIESQLLETAEGESANAMRQVRRNQSTALQTNFEDLISSTGLPDEVGQSIKDAINSKRKITKANAKAAYDHLADIQDGVDSLPVLVPQYQLIEGMPTPRELRSIKRTDSTNYNALQDALAEFGLSTDEGALKRLTKEGVAPEQLNARNFEEFRQALNSIRAADESGNMSRMMAPIIDELDRQVDIMTDVQMQSGNADVASAAKEARRNWKLYKEEFDPKSMAEILTQNKPRSVIPGIEVSQVYDKVMAKSVPIEQLDRLLETTKGAGGLGQRAIANLQANVVNDLLDSMFAGSTNKIGDTPVFSGAAFNRKFNEPKFNAKIQSIFKNNPEGYRQLQALSETIQDLTPGKLEIVKGASSTILDILNGVGIAKLGSVPGINVAVEQMRELGARSKNRAELNKALAARPELKLAANDLVRSFPMLGAALGIGYLSENEE